MGSKGWSTRRSLFKPLEVVEHYRYNGNKNNNQERVKAGNSNPEQYVQSKNAKSYYGNRQAEGKSNPFYDIYLVEEDECPGKARQEEDNYKPQYRSDGGQALEERKSKLK